MKHLKVIGTLALVLLLLVSFSVLSTAQDKKSKTATVKTDVKKSEKSANSSPCADKAKTSSCCDKDKKTTGKVLIKKSKEMMGSKAHDCTGCPGMKAEHKAEHKGECDHAKVKKGDNKEKK